MRDELDNHLSILKKEGIISNWYDREIDAGTDWSDEIERHLNSADLILLLVSSDFLASHYCYDIELKRALERHNTGEARVIPIILRPVYWENALFGNLQALPRDAKPVTTWANQDEAFANIAEGIRSTLLRGRTFGTAISCDASEKRISLSRDRIWNVPHLRNPNFTGRQEIMTSIELALHVDRSAAITQAIHGLGGIGKTQLAVEYAYRHRDEYSLVWWVRSEEPTTLANDYAALAVRLGLPVKDEPDQRVIITAVKEWFSQNHNWLLIFDNAADVEAIHDYIPFSSQEHVLVTSRNPNWGGIAKSLSVNILPQEEAIEFMEKRIGQGDLDTIRKLTEALGFLPLALEQAAAYMEATGSSVRHYLFLFETYQLEILSRGKLQTDYPATVATTWNLSFQRVETESPAAAELLQLCAFLAPEQIPLHVFERGTEFVAASLAAALADPIALDEVLATLRRFSLIEFAQGALSLHRLVQAVTRHRLDRINALRVAISAFRAVNTCFPTDAEDVRTWSECSILVPHALTALTHLDAIQWRSPEVAGLLNNVGLYLKGRAKFAEARTHFERALSVCETLTGRDEAQVATLANNLGSVLESLGDLDSAIANYHRALSIDEKSLGFSADYPAVKLDTLHVRFSFHLGKVGASVARMNYLGDEALHTGDHSAAKTYYESALVIIESVFKSTIPDTTGEFGRFRDKDPPNSDPDVIKRRETLRAWSIQLAKLGNVLKSMGDLQQARSLCLRSISIAKRAFRNDPISRSKLARFLVFVDEEVDVAELHPTVIRAATKESDPLSCAGQDKSNNISAARIGDLAIQLNNLGGALRLLGTLEEARLHFTQALTIGEIAFGKDHPQVAKFANNLGVVLEAQGDLQGAKILYERALRIDETARGSEHPEIAIRLNNLGCILYKMEDYPTANEYYERALRMFSNLLGEDHTLTVMVKDNLLVLRDAYQAFLDGQP